MAKNVKKESILDSPEFPQPMPDGRTDLMARLGQCLAARKGAHLGLGGWKEAASIARGPLDKVGGSVCVDILRNFEVTRKHFASNCAPSMNFMSGTKLKQVHDTKHNLIMLAVNGENVPSRPDQST